MSKRDYYEVLGFSKEPSVDEIKKTFGCFVQLTLRVVFADMQSTAPHLVFGTSRGFLIIMKTYRLLIEKPKMFWRSLTKMLNFASITPATPRVDLRVSAGFSCYKGMAR